MTLSNVEIADNIIDLLNKVKKNETFNDSIDKKEQSKLFNKIVKAGIKGQTNINIKTFKKEPNKYNIFIKDMMPSVKKENPTLSSSEIFKIIGALWTKDHPKKTKEPDNTKDTDNTKEPNNTEETKEPNNTEESDNTKETKETNNTKETKETNNTKKSKKSKK